MIVSSRSYWIFGQANPYIHGMDIHSVSGESDSIAEIILHTSSGWPMLTPSEYLFCVWLIWLYHHLNIEWSIRLTHAYADWISAKNPPDPTVRYILMCSPDTIVSSRSYWIFGQANPYIHGMDIHSVSSESDSIAEIILHTSSGWPMLTPSEYLFRVRLIRSYHISILECPSGWPMFTLTEYLLRIRLIQRYNIYYVFDWYDNIVEIILDIQSV